MIKSFGDTKTRKIYDGDKVKGFPPELYRVAQRKLDMLRRSTNVQDLRVPPGNRLEPLKGNMKGFFSIRINDQWRIVFRWDQGNAEKVRIVDYH